MKKLWQNQKGVTLIELLAAVAITAMIIGVATILLASVSKMFKTGSDFYLDQSNMKQAMNVLASQISDSTQIVYYKNRNELRYKTGTGYKAVIWDPTLSKLTVYDFSNDGVSSNNDTHFVDSTLSLSTNPTLYTEAFVLAEDVTGANFTYNNASIPATPLTNGQLVTIQLTFGSTNAGNGQVAQETKTTTVKLLDDSTTK